MNKIVRSLCSGKRKPIGDKRDFLNQKINSKIKFSDRPLPPQNFSFHKSGDDPLRVLFRWVDGNNFNSPIIGMKGFA